MSDERALESRSGDSLADAELSQFFDLSLDLMAIADPELRLLRVNSSWQRALGWVLDELQSMGLWPLIHPEDVAPAADALQRLGPGVPMVEFEVRVRSRDGEHHSISWTARAAGQRLHVVGRDVTERRLLERQLRQVQKMEAVGQVAGGVAHDLNNVLMAVLGFGELALAKVGPGDPLHEDLTMIVSGAKRAQSVIRRLLTFARRQPVAPRVVDLNEVCGGFERLLQPIVGRRVQLALELSDEPVLVFIDPGQLDQIVLNLATNARDAMPDGGRLTLRTRQTTLDAAFVGTHPGSRAGRFAALEVTDTGTGMDSQTLAHIFEPFFTTKPRDQGTGLGLPMVYGAMKQAGGYIWVDSTTGTGTQFELYFPVAVAAGAASTPDHAVATHPRPVTVLLIEDDRALRTLLSRMFVPPRFQLITAETDHEAWATLRVHDTRPDVLIADIPLGGTDATARVAEVRAVLPDRPILFLVDSSEPGLTPDPAIALLTKPFTREELLTRIDQLLAS